MRTLNRKLPYGEIHGGGPACFEQDGVVFDCTGKELNAEWGPDAPVVDQVVVEVPAAPDRSAEIVELAKQGKTPIEIGRMLSVHVAKVKAIIKRTVGNEYLP